MNFIVILLMSLPMNKSVTSAYLGAGWVGRKWKQKSQKFCRTVSFLIKQYLPYSLSTSLLPLLSLSLLTLAGKSRLSSVHSGRHVVKSMKRLGMLETTVSKHLNCLSMHTLTCRESKTDFPKEVETRVCTFSYIFLPQKL